MGQLEWLRLMHPAMSPVKPGIVRKKIEKNGQRPVPKRIITDVGIHARPAMIFPAPGQYAGGDPVNRGTGKAPADLTPDLTIKADIKAGMQQPGGPRERATDN